MYFDLSCKKVRQPTIGCPACPFLANVLSLANSEKFHATFQKILNGYGINSFSAIRRSVVLDMHRLPLFFVPFAWPVCATCSTYSRITLGVLGVAIASVAVLPVDSAAQLLLSQAGPERA